MLILTSLNQFENKINSFNLKFFQNIKQRDFQNSLGSTIFGPPLCIFTQLWENFYEME
jgi:hypothetical protein